MTKKKTKIFKITKEKQAELEKIAAELPSIQRIDGDGKPLTKAVKLFVHGHEIPLEKRSEIENFSEDKTYKTLVEEPVLINHAMAIRLCYLQSGQKGADAYQKFYNDLYDQQKEIAINSMKE